MPTAGYHGRGCAAAPRAAAEIRRHRGQDFCNVAMLTWACIRTVQCVLSTRSDIVVTVGSMKSRPGASTRGRMALSDDIERLLLGAGETRPAGQIGGFVVEDRDGLVVVWWRTALTVQLDALRRFFLGRYARTLRAGGVVVVQETAPEPHLVCTRPIV